MEEQVTELLDGSAQHCSLNMQTLYGEALLCQEAHWDYDRIMQQPAGWFGVVRLCWSVRATWLEAKRAGG